VDCAEIQPLSLSFRTGVWNPCTRTNVRLLGPCFKTGRRKPFGPRQQPAAPLSSTAIHQLEQHQQQRPSSKQPGKCRKAYTGFLRFLFSNFRYSLTALSRGFASFPHGTCTLSVSHQYLALDGIYHPLRAAIPNNSTRWPVLALTDTRESHPLSCPVPGDLVHQLNKKACIPQFITSDDSQTGLMALHSPLLDQS
jgi:hypothetical protein